MNTNSLRHARQPNGRLDLDTPALPSAYDLRLFAGVEADQEGEGCFLVFSTNERVWVGTPFEQAVQEFWACRKGFTQN